MATYCYTCKGCGCLATTQAYSNVPTCHGPMVRDYKSEAVGVAVVGLQREREAGGKEGLKRLFLPHNDDFKGPGDPDGLKGMREWRENNQPASGNKRPEWPGDVEKRVM